MKQYREENEAMRADHENYTRYCHGHLLPMLRQQRLTGKIVRGKLFI